MASSRGWPIGGMSFENTIAYLREKVHMHENKGPESTCTKATSHQQATQNRVALAASVAPAAPAIGYHRDICRMQAEKQPRKSRGRSRVVMQTPTERTHIGDNCARAHMLVGYFLFPGTTRARRGHTMLDLHCQRRLTRKEAPPETPPPSLPTATALYTAAPACTHNEVTKNTPLVTSKTLPQKYVRRRADSSSSGP